MDYSMYKNYLMHLDGAKGLFDWIESTDYLKAPASTKYHDACEGGWLDHTGNVINNILVATKIYNLQWDRPESPVLIGLLHDICKLNFYSYDTRNTKDEHDKWIKVPYYGVNDQFPIGHGEKSVIIAQKFMKLTVQEIVCIRGHMGAFGT